MKRGSQRTVVLLVLLGGGVAGWWITRQSYENSTPPVVARKPAEPAPIATSELPPKSKVGERKEIRIEDPAADEAGALKNQRSLIFSDRAAMERFLAAAKEHGIAILGRIDQLNALHVGFLSPADLAGLLDGSEEAGFIYPVNLPTPKTDGIQDGAVGMGSTLLSWLGISGDNSSYGSGVKVGILDTGSTLAGAKNYYLVDPPANDADWNGHGTAVADLIHQIAPGAESLSWRVANDSGQSNSFLLAQGILAAMDAGVDIINISMASYGNSTLLQKAVESAQAKGIKIYAASGNEGYDQVAYPAGYDGVVAMGAVDANGTYLNFSNRGNVTMTAPGLDLVTAWTGGKSVYFTGTSASSPIGAGVLAAAISNGSSHISTAQAYERVAANLNDAGAPGDDSSYGQGMVDFGRFFRSGTPGYSDAALASNYVSTTANGQTQLQVTVQNRGTAAIYNAPLQVTTSYGTSTMTSLLPGKIATFTLPFTIPNNGATVVSQITIPGANDLKPSNNRRSDAYSASASSN
jgi:hypothetical protein